MKGGRSQRPEPAAPSVAAADEWVDGSWTVDCSCGVTFDDGEEMVSCDECGVWVHTRCARYVHVAHTSFSCHKCKHSADEAEVAELLAELPTKSPHPPLASRPPTLYRRWAEVPLPERVHVHGPPGGDPGLFCDPASVFSAALWRSAGYVPKKFGFRYREFPSWDEDDDGPGALFELAKEKEGKDMAEAGLDAGSGGGGRKEEHYLRARGVAGRGRSTHGGQKRGRSVPIVRSASDAREDGCQQRGDLAVLDVTEKRMEESVELSCEKKSSEKMPGTAKKDELKVSLKLEMSSGVRAILSVEEQQMHPAIDKVELSMYKQYTEGIHCVGLQSSAINSVVKMDVGEPSTGDTTIHTGPEKMHDMVDHHHIAQKQSNQFLGNLQDIGNVPNLQFGQRKSQNIKGEATSQDYERPTQNIEFTRDEHKSNKEGLGDSGSLIVQRNSSEVANDSVLSENTKSETQNHMHIIAECSKSIGVAKVCTASSGPVFPHFELSSPLVTTEPSSAGKTLHLIKQEETKLVSSADRKHDSTKSSIFSEDNSHELARCSEKEQPRGSLSLTPKSSHASKTYAPSVKHRLPAPKEQLQKTATGGNPARSFHGETLLQSRSKPMSPSFSQKKEKVHHRLIHVAQEGSNNSAPIDLQASDATTLSDEQLALLLHQQLNSSPRVPRVPRGHQATSMHMLHPTGATVFSKRSSANGGRDQAPVLKKRNKDDASRDNSVCNEDARRAGKVPCVEQRHRDSTTIEHGPSVNDTCRSAENTESKQHNLAICSTEATAGSGRDDSMDNSASRNLPGLIDEIFNKNRNITYAELCNAVRPHWRDLRKHNGERYAYPSYLHAVNDCLRNRSEWAHLVDQAPKLSLNKRRKLENDSMLANVLETEKMRNKAEMDLEETCAESHQEDLPRGKRNARKRRRLELQGRRVKDSRKRSNNDSSSEDANVTSDSSSDRNDTPISEESQEYKSVAAETGTDIEVKSADSSSSAAD